MHTQTRPSAENPTRRVMSVLGAVNADALGITDAHNHVWIDAVPGGAPDGPVLTQHEGILAELIDFRQAGGSAILDCQPGGCGRDAGMLAELSRSSGVTIICATGFHRRRYYAPDYPLWNASPDQAAAYFTAELEQGVAENLPQADRLSQAETLPWAETRAALPVRAGFIKVACEAELNATPLNALQGAAQAAAASGVAIEIHTEKGAAAEAILNFMIRHGVSPRQVVLCHMDKRPDFGLHSELAQAGVLLEYDTFYRPKYEPERNLWPLLDKMVAAGLENSIALATDIAEAPLWARMGGGPGLAGLITIVRPRLQAAGFSHDTVRRLLGSSIIARLAQ